MRGVFMKIYFDGSSFAYGSELENKEDRYSNIIADYFGADEYNISKGGASNNRMCRQLLIDHNIEDFDVAVIQMSMAARTEWYNSEKGFEDIRPSTKMGTGVWKEHWWYYYRNVYDDIYGNVYEQMFSTAIRDHCKIRGVPLILATCRTANPSKYTCIPTTFKFDIDMNADKYPKATYGHPNKQGHSLIAKDIIQMIKNEDFI